MLLLQLSALDETFTWCQVPLDQRYLSNDKQRSRKSVFIKHLSNSSNSRQETIWSITYTTRQRKYDIGKLFCQADFLKKS